MAGPCGYPDITVYLFTGDVPDIAIKMSLSVVEHQLSTNVEWRIHIDHFYFSEVRPLYKLHNFESFALNRDVTGRSPVNVATP